MQMCMNDSSYNNSIPKFLFSVIKFQRPFRWCSLLNFFFSMRGIYQLTIQSNFIFSFSPMVPLYFFIFIACTKNIVQISSPIRRPFWARVNPSDPCFLFLFSFLLLLFLFYLFIYLFILSYGRISQYVIESLVLMLSYLYGQTMC